MKILSAEQVHELDAYTIEHEPIASVDLMERASHRFCQWFVRHFPDREQPVWVSAGIGNNGGDAFAIARLLAEKGYPVQVVWCKISDSPSEDCAINRDRLRRVESVAVRELHQGDDFPEIPTGAVVIDGMFGSGLNRPVKGYWAEWLEHLNGLSVHRVAIDIPSGLFADKFTEGTAFHASHTLSFQLPKRAFFFPENDRRVGKWTTVDIGLDKDHIQRLDTPFHYLDAGLAKSLLRSRRTYDHKGTYGHALLIMGSLGSMGAARLAGEACYRSGAGLVTLHAPRCGYEILQIGLPEAMVSLDLHKYVFSKAPALDRFAAIGIGCGLGTRRTTAKALRELLQKSDKPMVIDADALNLLAQAPELMDHIPPNSILTPHPKEFERLFGKTPNGFAANDLQREKARELHCVILLKRAHTAIALPDGTCYYNATGNPGMGTGGSGDVLTGILTGLVAQGYEPAAAACLGVYLHGLAGDLAAEDLEEEALLASDLTARLGKAFRRLREASA